MHFFPDFRSYLKTPEGTTVLMMELCNWLEAKRTPKVVVIDSSTSITFFPIYTSSSSWILMSQYVWRIIAAAGREKQTQNLLLHHFYGNLPNYVWQIVKTYQKPCMQNSADIFFYYLTNIFHIHEVFYWFARWFFINNSIVFLDIYLIIAIIRNENTSPTIWKKNIYL